MIFQKKRLKEIYEKIRQMRKKTNEIKEKISIKTKDIYENIGTKTIFCITKKVSPTHFYQYLPFNSFFARLVKIIFKIKKQNLQVSYFINKIVSLQFFLFFIIHPITSDIFQLDIYA